MATEITSYGKFDVDNMILEFDDTHLYRDTRSAYLMEMQEKSATETEAVIMDGFITLYSLGMADFNIDLTAMEVKNRVQLVLNQPS